MKMLLLTLFMLLCSCTDIDRMAEFDRRIIEIERIQSYHDGDITTLKATKPDTVYIVQCDTVYDFVTHFYPVADSALVVRMDNIEQTVNSQCILIDSLQSKLDRLTLTVQRLEIECGLSGVILRWEPVPNADGYKVYAGATTRHYDTAEDVGRAAYKVWESLPRITYLAVTAYRRQAESEYSEEVSW